MVSSAALFSFFKMSRKREWDPDEYQERLKTPQWRAFSKEMIKKRGAKCEECGSPLGLQVHHIPQYYKHYDVREPWEYDEDEVEVLCDRCHRERHGKGVSDPPPKQDEPSAKAKEAFEQWLTDTGRIEPTQHDWKMFPLSWMWEQFGKEFLREQEGLGENRR